MLLKMCKLVEISPLSLLTLKPSYLIETKPPAVLLVAAGALDVLLALEVLTLAVTFTLAVVFTASAFLA